MVDAIAYRHGIAARNTHFSISITGHANELQPDAAGIAAQRKTYPAIFEKINFPRSGQHERALGFADRTKVQYAG